MTTPLRCQKGFTLIEMIVSLALLAIVGLGLATALSTGSLVGGAVEDRIAAASVVTSQLEDTLAQTYTEPAEYPSVSTSERYTLSADNLVLDPTLLEKITAGVSTPEKALLEVTAHKANRSYIASPPSLLLAQRDFRWYENIDGLTPATPLTAENTPHTIRDLNQTYRLRTSIQIGRLPLAAGELSLKLQFATGTSGPWTDVGATGSGTIWRGYNNPSPTDGATIPSLLLSTSHILQSYEEQNPSATNPNSVAINEWAEWDWVVQENGAPYNTNFYFRMVESDDSIFGSYTRYPLIVMPPPLTLTQYDYRWYQNADSVNPTTPLSPEHNAYTASTSGLAYRLRLNVGVDGINLQPGAQAFKLQYATSTSGPWTDVGATGSGEIWRGYDNPSPTDGATITTLLSTSDVGESYEEQNPSVSNPNTINVDQRGEWDWVVEDNGTPDDTTYYFRMVKDDGTPVDAYTYYPELTTPPALSLTQEDYRWYGNADSTTPSPTLAAENTPFSGALPASVYRIRMNVTTGGADLPATTQAFKLQYATSTSGPWTDVGATGSGTIWRGYDNPSPTDGATITTLLSTSDVGESYEEQNPSVANPNTITAGQRGEWDWAVQNNGASGGTTYYFRMVKSDSSVLDGYSSYPEVATAPQVLTQQDYRWYGNADNTTPSPTLAAENSAYTSTAHGLAYRLRLNMGVGTVQLSAGAQAFKLQFATSTPGPWTDVGATGSGIIWRGYDNPSPADGATITTLLSTSDVGESYEEQNPSVANPNTITVGQRGEWDWAAQDNGAADSTTYYFRMVKSDGTALDSYSNYPQLTTPAALTLTQQDYRWYGNADSTTPSPALAAENTPFSGALPATVYRIRMNVAAGGADLPATTQAFKLQFATSTSGPWTDVGSTGSGEIWRGYDNPSPADGATITTLLSTSDVGESYEEQNPSVANPSALDVGERGEWDWVVHDNSAAGSTTYYFRMVKSDGTALDTYTRYPEITVPPPLTYTQEDYRWYENRNNNDPNTPLAAENTDYTADEHGEVYRIRMNLEAGGADLLEDTQAFKLQYATSTPGPWTDVGATGSGEIWRGYNNANPSDGDTVGDKLLSSSDEKESYEEQNPSVANPNNLDVGERGEWDWVVQDNSATADTTYYFRMVESDGTALDAYTRYPEITTAPPITFTQEDYRWYQNRNNKDPDTPLSAENTAFAAASTPTVFRLRMNVEVGGVDLNDDAQAFKLQYATSTSGPWTDVGATGSGTIWRGYNNANPSDGDTVGDKLLSSSDEKESYEEENPSVANPKNLDAGERGEWDWVVQDNSAAADTTYYFRMVKSDGTALDTYTRYPEITTIPPVIAWDDFESGGWSGGGGWLDAWYHEGDARVRKGGSPYEGSYHLRLRRSTGYVDRSVDLSGKTTVRLQFWAKAKSFEGGETATVSISPNDVDWTVVQTWVNGDDDNEYHFFDINLSAYSLTSTFWIAFDADMSGTNDHLYIDDLKLVGQ